MNDETLQKYITKFELLSQKVDSQAVEISSIREDHNNLYDRVLGNETKYMPAVKSAFEAKDATINLSKQMDVLQQILEALHKRNDDKDKEDSKRWGAIEKYIEEQRDMELREAMLEGKRQTYKWIVSVFGVAILSGIIALFTYLINTVHSIDKAVVINSQQHKKVKHDKESEDDNEDR